MANTKSTQHEIPLTSELNLNKFKAEIKPYSGFNERNSPYYGGCLSPLWMKDDGIGASNTKYYKGHKYSIRTAPGYNYLQKDDTDILRLNNTRFSKEILSNKTGFENKEILDFYDEHNYVEVLSNGRIKVHYRMNENMYEQESELAHNYAGQAQYIKKDDYIKSVFVYDDYSNSVYFAILVMTEVNNYHQTVYYSKNGFLYEMHGLYLYTSWGVYDNDYLYVNNQYVQVNSSIIRISDNQLMKSVVSFNDGDWWLVGSDNQKYFYYLNYTEMYKATETNNVWSFSYVGNINNEISDNQQARLVLPCLYKDHSIIYYKDRITKIDNYIGTRGFITVESFEEVTSNGETFLLWHATKGSTESYSRGDWLDNPHVGLTAWASGDDDIAIHITNGQYFTPFFECYVKGHKHITWSITNFTGGSHNIHVFNNVFFSFFDADSGVLSYIYSSDINYSLKSIGNASYYVPAGNLSIGVYSNNLACNVLFNSVMESVQGISVNDTLITSWGSVDTYKTITPWSYYDSDLKDWVIYKRDGNYTITCIGDWVVVNTTSTNCYNIKTGKTAHWADDWNSRMYVGNDAYRIMFIDIDLTNPTSQPHTIASAINPNFLTDYPSSLLYPAITFYSNYDNHNEYWAYPAPSDSGIVDVFIDYKYVGTATLPNGISNGVNVVLIQDPNLEGATYPSDNVRYNIPILFDVIDGPINLTIVNFGSNTSFFTIYQYNKNRYVYYDTSITEYEVFFVIQGQAYGISDEKIFAITYSEGMVQAETPIVAIGGLQFIGNTIYNAYFYSNVTKTIYAFGADNNLSLFIQSDTIDSITGSDYVIESGSLIIGTSKCTYVLNEQFGIYRIPEIKNATNAEWLSDNTIVIVSTDYHTYKLIYEKPEVTTGWEKNNIILDTSFYGAGSNVVSVNDCWYIRVTDAERGEGEIKLSVSTLTDVGRTTEERTFKIKAKDWDELTDTVYIRFQPKLQRAVGVSLHIESPFKVGYIGVGATPETLQLNKGTI